MTARWAAGRHARQALACVALAAALAAVQPGRAAAERAIVLPHGGDASLHALREQAQQAVIGALAEQGFQVRTDSAPAGRTGASGQPERCTQIDCAAALLAAAFAELAVVVAVWQVASGPQIHVTLSDAEGHRYHAAAAADSDGVEAAARRALLDARALQLLGPGPWLRVDGAPEGARVSIDGAFVGTLPYRGALRSGDHRLEVAADGFAPQVRELQVPLDPTALVHVEVALAPEDAARASRAGRDGAEYALAPRALGSDARNETEPSVWNYVLGAAAIAGGLALATVDPVRSAVRDGDCVDRDCTRMVRFGSQSALKIAAGALVAGGGVALLVWRPLRVSPGEGRAAVSLGGTF